MSSFTALDQSSAVATAQDVSNNNDEVTPITGGGEATTAIATEAPSAAITTTTDVTPPTKSTTTTAAAATEQQQPWYKKYKMYIVTGVVLGVVVAYFVYRSKTGSVTPAGGVPGDVASKLVSPSPPRMGGRKVRGA